MVPDGVRLCVACPSVWPQPIGAICYEQTPPDKIKKTGFVASIYVPGQPNEPCGEVDFEKDGKCLRHIWGNKDFAPVRSRLVGPCLPIAV